jgi:hypothetical protein
MSPYRTLSFGALLLACALGLDLACVDNSAQAHGAPFTLVSGSASASVASGGNVAVPVSVLRYQDAGSVLTLSLTDPPAGVTASGSIAAQATSGTLELGVSAGVAAQTFSGLHLQILSSSGASQTMAFLLTVVPATAPIGPDQVAASGLAQSGGGISNFAQIGEPINAVNQSSSNAFVQGRTDFIAP